MVCKKQEACRLLSMTYLAMDSTRLATDAAIELLSINPNFEADIFDPPIFIAIVRTLKESGSTLLVKSVSKKAESLYEAPGIQFYYYGKGNQGKGLFHMEALFSDLPGFDISGITVLFIPTCIKEDTVRMKPTEPSFLWMV